MFLANCWYVAAWEHDLQPAKPLGVCIIGLPVVLFRSDSGAIHALSNRCAHRGAPLSLGRIEGNNIRCAYHGLVFAPDGSCREVPGSKIIPRGSTVRVYPVCASGSWIWVWMGDPLLADPKLVPEAFGLNDPRWVMRAGCLDFQANYMLVNDNLCDLSHVDFVHEKTLGLATGGGWAQSLPGVTGRERGVRIERWLVAKPASPNNPSLVDTWSAYDYTVPGVFIMENRSYPHGVAEQSGYKMPTSQPMTYRVEQQAVTPVNELETRYFFATGIDSRLPSRLIQGIFDTVTSAFSEDKAMIEAQQRIWNMTATESPMAFIPQDKAPSMFRRILSRLIANEKPTG